jgi:hypothetical protein
MRLRQIFNKPQITACGDITQTPSASEFDYNRDFAAFFFMRFMALNLASTSDP